MSPHKCPVVRSYTVIIKVSNYFSRIRANFRIYVTLHFSYVFLHKFAIKRDILLQTIHQTHVELQGL